MLRWGPQGGVPRRSSRAGHSPRPTPPKVQDCSGGYHWGIWNPPGAPGYRLLRRAPPPPPPALRGDACVCVRQTHLRCGRAAVPALRRPNLTEYAPSKIPGLRVPVEATELCPVEVSTAIWGGGGGNGPCCCVGMNLRYPHAHTHPHGHARTHTHTRYEGPKWWRVPARESRPRAACCRPVIPHPKVS